MHAVWKTLELRAILKLWLCHVDIQYTKHAQLHPSSKVCKQCLPNVPQLVRRHNSPHSVREPQSVCGLSTQFAAFQDARKKLSQICCAISEALCLEPSDSTAENLLFHCPCKIITAEGIILQNCLEVACNRQPEIESKIPCSGWVILCMDSVSNFKKITFLNLLRQNTICHNTN